MLAAVIVVGVGFEVMMMVMREMGEDELEADFDDDDGNDQADIGFDVDLPDEVDESGDEDGDGDPSVIHGLGAGGGENGGLFFLASAFQPPGEEIFEQDRNN